MTPTAYDRQVFINCPFDDHHRELFEAIVFAVLDCGFSPRCSLEIEDGSQIRIEKIFSIISDCKFGLHDLSRTELDPRNNLPRFNMPLELGMFLGAKRYGGTEQKEKVCLILDRESHRYQEFISDIAGQDIRDHGDDAKRVITVVRNWLRSAFPQDSIPSGEIIGKRYSKFRKNIPALCRRLKLSPGDLTFLDYIWLIFKWLEKTERVRPDA